MALTNYDLTIDSTDTSLRIFPGPSQGAPVPTDISISIEQATLTSQTNALTTQRRSLGAHRIRLEYAYAPMSADEVQPFIAFFNAMGGQAKAFKLNVPKELINDSNHITDGSLHTSTGTVAAGQRTAIFNGFGNNLTTAIKGGNFIQPSGSKKIYIVAADGGSDSSGNCRIRFEPALLSGITSSTTLNTFSEDIPLHAIFASSDIQFDVNSALLYGFKIKFTEQWMD